MARKSRKRTYASGTRANNTKGKGSLVQSIVLLVLLGVGALIGYSRSDKETQEAVSVTGGQAVVHFIDVGQGDSIFIQGDSGNMLIDAGENGNEEDVLGYLDSLGITHIDNVTATHPHSDHIGGMEEVLEKYDVGHVFMPPAENTSKTFENMIDQIEAKNIPVTAPKPGDVIDLGSAKLTVLAPNQEEYDNLNNYSIAYRMVTSGPSFMFTADAEKLVEKEILENGLEVDSDILKVGHHGSSTSTSQEFFDAVSPDVAVISVGADNSYGHPHEETMEILDKAGIPVYRTDENGDIVVTVADDGTYTITTERE